MKFSTLNTLTYSKLNQKTYGDLEKTEIVATPIEITFNESSLKLKIEDVKLISRITLTSNKFKLSYCDLKGDRLSYVRRISSLTYTARRMNLSRNPWTMGIRLNLQCEESKLRINRSTIKLSEVAILKFKDALLELKKIKNVSYEIKNILDIESYKLVFNYKYMVISGFDKPYVFINAAVTFNNIELTDDKNKPVVNSTVYMAPESF